MMKLERITKNITEGIKPIADVAPKANLVEEHVDIIPNEPSNTVDMHISGNHGETLHEIKMRAISQSLNLSTDTFMTKYLYEQKKILFEMPQKHEKLNTLEELSKLHVDRLKEHAKYYAHQIQGNMR